LVGIHIFIKETIISFRIYTERNYGMASLRRGKGQSVQIFTKEFRKKSLDLNIPLDSQETLLKYIGSLYKYIPHCWVQAYFEKGGIFWVHASFWRRIYLEERHIFGKEDLILEHAQQVARK
jgi:hypothetical protein